MRKVCVIIGSRANYSSIKSVLRAVRRHPALTLQLIVGASALLDRFGSVVEVIEADGFKPDARVTMIVEGETPATMAKSTGLRRTGVNYARVPPGKESFAYHAHWQEEEWIYVLEGRGIARIDGVEYEVAAGDFMAFPTPGVAHHLSNPFDTDLVYLMGGENRDVEIADFPDLGKRILRRGKELEVHDLKNAEEFGPLGEE